MKASELIKKDLNDGDTIVLESDVEHIICRCCDCGLMHDIKIDRCPNGIIRMSFNRVEGDPEIESPRDLTIEPASKIRKR